jgi:hypothetical protein
MKIYSIVRIGDEYVVRAGDKNVLKVASRRRAAQLVTDAAELMDLLASPQLSPQDPGDPSIACDPETIPDPPEVP